MRLGRLATLTSIALAIIVTSASVASAHVVPTQSITIDCQNIFGLYKSFPSGKQILTVTVLDTIEVAPGKGAVVPTTFDVPIQGPSGSFGIVVPAPAGTVQRDVTVTWLVDGGGTTSASAKVSCGTYVPPAPSTVIETPPTTVFVEKPGPVQYVNVPGAVTIKTVIKTIKKIVYKTKTKVVYKRPKVHVECPKDFRVLITWTMSGSDVTVSCFPTHGGGATG